jgi:hypothetical protein
MQGDNMIRLIITDADVRKSSRDGWLVEHPSNGAILAYCETEDEAKRVRDAINDMARTLRTVGEKVA